MPYSVWNIRNQAHDGIELRGKPFWSAAPEASEQTICEVVRPYCIPEDDVAHATHRLLMTPLAGESIQVFVTVSLMEIRAASSLFRGVGVL